MAITLLTEEEIQKLETDHKRIAHIIGKDRAWQIVIRKPNRGEYKRLRSMLHNPAMVSDAQETIIRQLVVHPAREAFDALLEDYPGIPEACGEPLRELCGMAVEESVK